MPSIRHSYKLLIQNKMKKLLLGLAILLLGACGQQTTAPPIQPSVSFGYIGNTYVARVMDQRGQEYAMDYVWFKVLMDKGGYNAVDSYYWNHPGDTYLHTWTQSNWRTSYTTEATQYGSMYRSSYHTLYVTHHVYAPSSTVINRVTVVHHTTVIHPAPAPTSGLATKYNSPTTPSVVKSTPTRSTPSTTKVSMGHSSGHGHGR